jgi:hypothetical protein
MDNNLFEVGLAKRKATLGAEYVEKSLDAADDFSRPFQEAMTAWCWGFGWDWRAWQNDRMGIALSWRHQKRRNAGRIARDHPCDWHLLRCAAGPRMHARRPQGDG